MEYFVKSEVREMVKNIYQKFWSFKIKRLFSLMEEEG